MHNHERGKERVDGLHNAAWNHFLLRVVSVEMQRREYSQQHLVEERSIVSRGGSA